MQTRRIIFRGVVVLLSATAASLMGAATNVSAGSAAAKPAAASPGAPEVENGYLKLGFDQLASFVFVPPTFDAAATGKTPTPAQSGEEQIPARVKSWSGKKAAITGFMIPVKMEKGLATEFLVMRNTLACCYGGTPAVTEWVVAKMKKGGVPVTMDVPVIFYGDLKVGPIFENGYLNGIYQLDCERMGEVKG
jgi:hypothetical protein